MEEAKTNSISGREPSPSLSHLHEVRYSLREMMEEVREERKHTQLERGFVDSAEITSIFAKRKKKRLPR